MRPERPLDVPTQDQEKAFDPTGPLLLGLNLMVWGVVLWYVGSVLGLL